MQPSTQLSRNDRSTIQSLMRAYQVRRCDLEEFVREARAILLRFNPQLTEREIDVRVGQILARMPA